MFSNEERKTMSAQLKEGQKNDVAAMSKVISEKWGKMTDQQKKKYEKLTEDDTKRFNN